MPSTRYSETIASSIRRESDGHHSTVSYHSQTFRQSVQTTSSNAGNFTGSRHGADSNARGINQSSGHDDRHDRTPRHEARNTRRHQDGVGSRNSSTRPQATGSTHDSRRHEQNPQRLANRSQLSPFIYNTKTIADGHVGRQHGFELSNRRHDAQRHIREFEEKFERRMYEKKS